MRLDLDRVLESYGDTAVRVGLNLQPGQRLLMIGPVANGGVGLEAAPLVRCIAASAYRAGARLVEVLWGDEALVLARFREAPRDAFTECSAWLAEVLSAHADAGGAILSVYANDPDLLRDAPPDLVGAWQQAVARSLKSFRERISRNQTNWSVVAGASPRWAARVFPDVPPEQQLDRLWETIVRLCRLDGPDPVAAWQGHVDALAARRDYLNDRRFSALRYRGPGTDLTVGLPDDHLWVSARSTSRQGISFTANIPTEEVFTLPDRRRVDGTVRGSKPLSYGGTLVDDFTLSFEGGKVVRMNAGRPEHPLNWALVGTDAGAAHLERNRAPTTTNSSISQSGLLLF